jgi:hypothetical protein
MSGALLFSGTDLASLCIVEDLSEFWSSSDVRGDLSTYAGVPGASPQRRPMSNQVRSGQVSVVDADTLAQAEDAVAAVKAALRVNRAQTLTRRKVTGAGNLDATQTAIVRTVAERWLNNNTCTLLLGVELCDGYWLGASEAIGAVGAVTVKGDLPTRLVTVTLAAGAVDPVVTNATNGYTFRYIGTVPAGGVSVDVAARRATGITGSVDLSANLRWSKSDPFQLDPGANTLTISSGSASFTYYPAYQ